MNKDSRAFDCRYVKVPLLPDQVKVTVLLNCPDLRIHALGVPHRVADAHEPGDLLVWSSHGRGNVVPRAPTTRMWPKVLIVTVCR